MPSRILRLAALAGAAALFAVPPAMARPQLSEPLQVAPAQAGTQLAQLSNEERKKLIEKRRKAQQERRKAQQEQKRQQQQKKREVQQERRRQQQQQKQRQRAQQPPTQPQSAEQLKRRQQIQQQRRKAQQEQKREQQKTREVQQERRRLQQEQRKQRQQQRRAKELPTQPQNAEQLKRREHVQQDRERLREERLRKRREQTRQQRRELTDAERQRLREERLRKRREQVREDRQHQRREQTREERQRERRQEALREKRREERAEQIRRQRREARRDERRFQQMQERRRQLRRELQQERRRTERLAERNERLRRQREWERRQAQQLRRQNRRLRDDRFYERADIVRRDQGRIILRDRDRYFVWHDDVDRFGWNAERVDVQPWRDGWTRTVVVRPNGVRVVTVRDANGWVVQRYRVLPGGGINVLFNNQPAWWDQGDDYYVDVAPVTVNIPRERYVVEPSVASPEVVYDTLTAPPVQELDRSYTLNQVLLNANLRDYMPRVDLDTITFALNSAEVPLDQLDQLEKIGVAIEEAISENPDEVFLIEGHTDATGPELYNLELSDRRAEEVARILTEYFDIPPENLVTQGFGEQFLKVPTQAPEEENRRVAIRRITPLLSADNSNLALANGELGEAQPVQ